MIGDTDSELVRRTRSGDVEAYAVLMARWSPRVISLCRARVGQWSMVEDLVQETFFKAYRKLAMLLAPEKFGGWLGEIAVHCCQDWLKSRGKRDASMSQVTHLENFAPSTNGTPRDDRMADLIEAADSLPIELREVLWIYYRENLSYREIGELIGVSAATVNARLTKARQLLRAQLTTNPSKELS